jgi:hypothetical protein
MKSLSKTVSKILLLTLFLVFTFIPYASYSEEAGNANLVAHWKFDGNLEDSSQYGNNGSLVGTSNSITFVDGVIGKGACFNGKSYIEVKNSSSLDLKSSFTFSLWVYKEDMRDKQVPYILKLNDEYLDYHYAFWEWWNMEPGVFFSDDQTTYDAHPGCQVDIQKWSLLTVTYDGSTVKFFNDGELVASKQESVVLASSGQPLYIGFGNIATEDSFFKGVMDDVRIYNKAISPDDVEKLYKDGITGPGKNLVIKPNKLVAFYRFEGNCKDISGMKNDGTASGSITYTDGVAGKAAKFGGSGYITVKDSDSLDLDKGLTVAVWLYKNNVEDDQPIIAKYGESHDIKACSYKLTDINGGQGQRFELMDFSDSTNMTMFDSDKETAGGKWYYYTATYDGKNVKVYIDGVLNSTSPFTGDISNSSGPLWIGAAEDTVFFKGIMDELRIYNYAFTSSQVSTLYGMRDRLDVSLADTKASLSALKVKQSVKLKVSTAAYSFTVPSAQVLNGKDILKLTDVTSKATYKSSNTRVFTVDKTGKLTVKGKGTATLTVSYGKYKQNVIIKVK